MEVLADSCEADDIASSYQVAGHLRNIVFVPQTVRPHTEGFLR